MSECGAAMRESAWTWAGAETATKAWARTTRGYGRDMGIGHRQPMGLGLVLRKELGLGLGKIPGLRMGLGYRWGWGKAGDRATHGFTPDVGAEAEVGLGLELGLGLRLRVERGQSLVWT